MSDAATRTTLHLLCARVLATRRFIGTGRLGLDVRDGQLIAELEDGSSVSLDGAGLHAGGRTMAITTVRAAADFAGIDASAIVHDALKVACDEDAPLAFDRAVATSIIEYFSTVKAALQSWSATLEIADQVTTPVLWPEHFDLAVVAGTEPVRANYGGSPGDEWCDGPYLYVGPFVQRQGPTWNAPFGRSLAASHLAGPDIEAFFGEGRRDLGFDPRPA